MNPLLDFSGLPRYADVEVAHVAPAIDCLIAEVRAAVARIGSDARRATWDTVVAPQLVAQERLERAWNVVAHLNAVVNAPALRTAYTAALGRITALRAEVEQDARLFARYRELRASNGFAALEPSRQRLVDTALRDFRLGGAELASAAKERLRAVREEEASLMARFEDNVLDATNGFALHIDDAGRLAGMPLHWLDAAREAAAAEGRAGWKITLHAPSYLPVMQHARDRALRETLYRAYTTRASEFGPAEWNNGPLIVRLLELRHEEARLLGFANYAELSLAVKMAKAPDAAIAFLREVAGRAKPHAERDMAELREFARDTLGLDELAAWDIDFAGERLREARYDFSREEVRRYFPEDRVLGGMFKVVETIFGLHIREASARSWHRDVRFFEIREPTGELVGQFYLDLHARTGKRSGAWMDTAIERKRENGSLQTPVATLTCNFSGPAGGRPALFTHAEATTLFHEFGHGLHLLLTAVEHLGVGMGDVEWDAIELPSQFMENFCWEWEVVRHMSGDVDTGEPLPRTLFDKVRAARHFQSGMHFVRQLQFGLFDLELHRAAPMDLQGVERLLADVRREVAVFDVPEYNRFPLQFSHIFASAYAAGYYSYLWAQVLSADAYALFEEVGILSPAAGQRFRREILGPGSSRTAEESFVAFRGRPPTIDAFLRNIGM
jgi:oligopeptidase A